MGDAPAQPGFGQAAVGQGGADACVVHRHAGHHDIVAGQYAAGRRACGVDVGGCPVGHDKAGEAEFTPGHFGAQIIAVGRMHAVDQVVACHNRAGAGFPHGNFEPFEVELPQAALGQDAV